MRGCPWMCCFTTCLWEVNESMMWPLASGAAFRLQVPKKAFDKLRIYRVLKTKCRQAIVNGSSVTSITVVHPNRGLEAGVSGVGVR